mmetsp:Transcript_3917/g.9832  ORF Transcript_3917/g.9832 Transcript_3917/m.9832 type:complete len:300 (-) Transcript_3917:347-1246(-)
MAASEQVSFPFESRHRAVDHDDSSGDALMAGVVVDFLAAAPDDDDVDASEKRHLALAKGLDAAGVRVQPFMAVDLAPVRDLDLLLVDGGDDQQKKTPFAEVTGLLDRLDRRAHGDSTGAGGKARPVAARLVVPARQIVDIGALAPVAGRSVVRCNPAFPVFRWFQAMNLLLRSEGKGGRVIPFPIESEAPNGGAPSADPLRNVMYHVLRVSQAEFERYQELLAAAIAADGPELGFFHAGKFAYEVLLKRGLPEINEQVVGKYVTSVVLMGRPRMRGALVVNSAADDWGEELERRRFVYA